MEDCGVWGFCACFFTLNGLFVCEIPSEDTPEEPAAVKTQKTVFQSFFDIFFFDLCYL